MKRLVQGLLTSEGLIANRVLFVIDSDMVVIVSLVANNPWVSGNYNALNFTVSIVFVNIVLSTIGKPTSV